MIPQKKLKNIHTHQINVLRKINVKVSVIKRHNLQKFSSIFKYFFPKQVESKDWSIRSLRYSQIVLIQHIPFSNATLEYS